MYCAPLDLEFHLLHVVLRLLQRKRQPLDLLLLGLDLGCRSLQLEPKYI